MSSDEMKKCILNKKAPLPGKILREDSEKKLNQKREEMLLSKYKLEQMSTDWKVKYEEFTDQDCLTLSCMIKKNTNLKTLLVQGTKQYNNDVVKVSDISHIAICDSGVKYIAEALHSNSVLTSIDLRNNWKIGLSGGQLLADIITKSNTIKNFSCIPVYDLKENSPTVKELDLWNCGCCITEALVIKLLMKNNTVLEKVTLNVPLTFEDFRGKRKKLDFSTDEVDDVDAIIIAALISTLTKYKCFNMRNAEMTTIGARMLADAVIESEFVDLFSGISILDLKQNDVRYTSLSMRQGGCGETEGFILASLLQSNNVLTSLEIRRNPNIKGGAAKNLATTIIENNFISTFSGIPILKLKENCSAETVLVLDGTGCSETEAFVLASLLKINTVLKALSLKNNSLGDIGVQAIGNSLKSNSTLVKLDLTQTQISVSGTEAFVAMLQVNTSLKTLYMGYNPNIDGTVSYNLAVSIIQSKTIQLFSGILMSDIKGNTSKLTEFILSKTGCGDAEAIILGLLLQNNSTLTELDFSQNLITSVGSSSIAKGLKSNSKLTLLRLSNNRINDDEMQDFGESLRKNCTLKKLILTANMIGDIGALAIGNLLKINNVLEVLYLSYNNIGNSGAEHIAIGLENNSALKNLYLSYNKMGGTGIEAIVKALSEKNKTLARINLKGNAIDQELKAKLKSVFDSSSRIIKYFL